MLRQFVRRVLQARAAGNLAQNGDSPIQRAASSAGANPTDAESGGLMQRVANSARSNPTDAQNGDGPIRRALGKPVAPTVENEAETDPNTRRARRGVLGRAHLRLLGGGYGIGNAGGD